MHVVSWFYECQGYNIVMFSTLTRSRNASLIHYYIVNQTAKVQLNHASMYLVSDPGHARALARTNGTPGMFAGNTQDFRHLPRHACSIPASLVPDHLRRNPSTGS